MRKNYFDNVEKQLAATSKVARGQGCQHWDNSKVRINAAKLPRGQVYERLQRLKQDKIKRIMKETAEDVLNHLGLPSSLYNPMLF